MNILDSNIRKTVFKEKDHILLDGRYRIQCVSAKCRFPSENHCNLDAQNIPTSLITVNPLGNKETTDK